MMGWAVVLGCLPLSTTGQPPGRSVPLADRVDAPLLPSGIANLPLTANAQLAYIFKDQESTEVLHLIGDVLFTFGEQETQTFRSREAVVWLTERLHEGRSFRRLEILLWQEVRIKELGGTITSGPVLMVTLNTTDAIRLNVDDIALQSSSSSDIYREGDRIRKAIKTRALHGLDPSVSVRVVDAAGLTQEKEEAHRPRPIIQFQSLGEVTLTVTPEGARALTATGRVFLSRATPGAEAFFQMQADSVVVFLPADGDTETFSSGQIGVAGLGRDPGRKESSKKDLAVSGAKPRPRADRRGTDRPQLLSSAMGEAAVEAVYLEGDVILTQGANRIRASRLYYDFQRERAVILDAVVRTTLVGRNLPLYIRAAEIRQLSAKELVATDAVLTTSEFHTPHYHVGARRVELINRTPWDPCAGTTGIRSGSFAIRHATLNLGGVPIAYWPYFRGNVNTSETAVKRFRTGFSNRFGLEIETEWDLFNVLGLETPDGFNARLKLESFSERGPAAGINVDYKRDRYFGLVRSYFLSDDGEDFLGRSRETPPQRDVRGRFLLRHRQYRPNDWQLTLEVSYISDESFLEEFFESEFDKSKEQETLLYLKRQRDNWAFTALLQTRILDFTTQTERLPDFSFHLAGEPARLAGVEATWFSENRAGIVRYRPKDRSFIERLRDWGPGESGATIRLDSRQELEAPFQIGPWRLVPFVTVRGTAWDDSPDSGGLARSFGVAGVRSSAYFTRTYPDTRSTLLDLHGIRHIIKTDATAWVASTNRDADELFPFDETVEEIAGVDGITLGVRQRWQTKRGAPETRRIVDVLTLDVEAGLFNGAEPKEITNGYVSFSRPENSISRNFVNSSLIWRLNDRTALLSELNYDLNDGEVDILNISMAVERSPRFSYILGYRFIEESRSNLLGFDMNYRLSEKHTLALREAFDLQRGQTLDFTIAFIRRSPGWFGALSFALDEAEDDFGVSVSIWPEGVPQAALGSRRFTGLARTTGLNQP